MRNALLFISLICIGMIEMHAAVLGIFEDTNFPVALFAERDGVHRLEVIDNELYAATEKGIYRYSAADNSWSCHALENVNVMDFKADGDELVAIIIPDDRKTFRAVEVATLVRFNIHGGDVEEIMDAGMGYDYHDTRLTYVMRLAQHPADPRTLMVAAYPGIWISEDFGATWKFKYDWLFSYNENQFLGWHPRRHDVLFYTSESAYFNAQILRSADGGENWDIINPDHSGDNSCHHLAFDPADAGHILYSGEGCIFESEDCGESWHCVYRQDEHDRENGLGYAYNVMFDPENVGVAYAVGCVSHNEDIHIFRSVDNGKTWVHIAKSDSFEEKEYWVDESVLFNGKIYIYTRRGVLSYDVDSQLTIDGILPDVSSSSPIFDLYGRRTDNPVSGNIYITRGKKFVQK